MKIALIGTHGTGKTTMTYDLIANLKKEGYNSDLLQEVARSCPLPINESTTKEAQEWIIYSQYIKELELEKPNQILICDRSIIDGYVYYRNKFGRNSTLEKFVKEKSKTYKEIFRVPMREELLKDDGFRSTNKLFQQKIDGEFDRVIGSLKIESKEYTSLESALDIIKSSYRLN